MRPPRFRDSGPRSLAAVGSMLLVTGAVAATGGWSSPLFLLYYPALALAAHPRVRVQLALAGIAAVYYVAALALTGWNVSPAELALRLAILVSAACVAGYRAGELERRAAELEQLAADKEFLGLHDPLTGLANRSLFDDRLRQALASAERLGSGAALAILDLDGFKSVNDTYGHQVGDAALRELAPRLSDSLRRVDTVARFGGDEFAIVLPGLTEQTAALRVARALLAAVRTPCRIGDLVVELDASVGVALFPAHAVDADSLLRCADYAMYRAKERHTGVELADPPPGPLAGEVA